MTENELSRIVIGSGLKVHSALGPGLLESAYSACLHYELFAAGLFCRGAETITTRLSNGEIGMRIPSGFVCRAQIDAGNKSSRRLE